MKLVTYGIDFRGKKGQKPERNRIDASAFTQCRLIGLPSSFSLVLECIQRDGYQNDKSENQGKRFTAPDILAPSSSAFETEAIEIDFRLQFYCPTAQRLDFHCASSHHLFIVPLALHTFRECRCHPCRATQTNTKERKTTRRAEPETIAVRGFV
jgi:hypothetical protein